MAVTVRVWVPWEIPNASGGIEQSGIGHASLEVNGRYLSFWPVSAEFTVGGAMVFSPSAFQTYSADVTAEEGPPDHVVTLNKLNEKRILSLVSRIKSKKPPYHPKLFNCSHPVKIALYEGTDCKVGPNFAVSVNPVYGVTQQLPYWLRGGRVESWVKDTWNPIDVAKYAKLLKRVVG